MRTLYFDIGLQKKATPITGKVELEENGSNLPIVLKNIIEQNATRKKFLNLMQDILPFFQGVKVEKYTDNSLLISFKEAFFEKQYLPASLISDGTFQIVLLILGLQFEQKNLIIIEEPERNIHPYLISRMVNMMKDASLHKQIIVTTHNPEIVKYTELENILFISRDNTGFSTISRPIDKQEIHTFLQNEIGIEELFIQNLLGI